MKLNLKYQPVAKNAPLFARDIVEAAREITGMDLDYSVASLRHVDDIIEGLRRDGVRVDAIGGTLFGFGTYVGEVFVRNAGAVWIDFDKSHKRFSSHAFGIEMPDGALRNPLGKVFKRFANGAEDSVEYFYQALGPQAS
jgi:hypothetical protein